MNHVGSLGPAHVFVLHFFHPFSGYTVFFVTFGHFFSIFHSWITNVSFKTNQLMHRCNSASGYVFFPDWMILPVGHGWSHSCWYWGWDQSVSRWRGWRWFKTTSTTWIELGQIQNYLCLALPHRPSKDFPILMTQNIWFLLKLSKNKV